MLPHKFPSQPSVAFVIKSVQKCFNQRITAILNDDSSFKTVEGIFVWVYKRGNINREQVEQARWMQQRVSYGRLIELPRIEVASYTFVFRKPILTEKNGEVFKPTKCAITLTDVKEFSHSRLEEVRQVLAATTAAELLKSQNQEVFNE